MRRAASSRSEWRCPSGSRKSFSRKLNLEKALRAFSPSGKIDGKLLFAEHHQSHAASAFFPSPFEEAWC